MAVSEEYRDALANALGNVVICDTDEAASTLSQRKKLNVIIRYGLNNINWLHEK